MRQIRIPSSLHDALEARVVVLGVKAGFRFPGLLATADDAACSPVARAGRSHGVLSVVAPGFARQQTLAVAEHRAILGVRERPPLADQALGVAGLGGQI